MDIQNVPSQPQLQEPVVSQPQLILSPLLILGGIIIILLIGTLGYYLGKTSNKSIIYPTPTISQQKACTLEAKICPDGSSVGRILPNCEFAPCPIGSVTPMVVIPSLTPTIIVQDETAKEENSFEKMFQNTVEALRANNRDEMYQNLAPSLKVTFTYENFVEGYNSTEQNEGKIKQVDIISEPQLKTGGEWGENKWAEGKIRIDRERGSSLFLVRLIKEEGKWWVFGTIKV